jgi:hypothetical protein
MDPETRRNLQKARRLTAGEQRVEVSWNAIGGLALRVAVDRGYDVEGRFGSLNVPEFFEVIDQERWHVPGIDVEAVVAWLEEQDRHNAVYLELLLRLFARRLKYRRILSTQAFATSDQVGPRALLEHGLLDTEALRSLVVWRKWMMDVDNRSGQETGYLYDAIVARALGGTAFGSRNSPIQRAPTQDGSAVSGQRQVDCIVDNPRGKPWAYEVKIRITDAASRQGRLEEELAFPRDCKFSGYIPRLLVFDPTPCETLTKVARAFEEAGGQVFRGEEAYEHIKDNAGHAQAEFLRRYVVEPLKQYEDTIPDATEGRELVDLRLAANKNRITVELKGFEPYVIERHVDPRSVKQEEPPLDE